CRVGPLHLKKRKKEEERDKRPTRAPTSKDDHQTSTLRFSSTEGNGSMVEMGFQGLDGGGLRKK
ncbi:hypothetical protein PJI17_31895, partial [Mycobacterium kansasii]